jgi:Tfp pilus assembly ATPase PilU
MGCGESIPACSERGIQSFDAALYQLNKEGRIGAGEALAQADSCANLEAHISLG